MNSAALSLKTVSGGVPPRLASHIEAPHAPSSVQHRTAAVPCSSSVHSMAEISPHASTVSAKG